MPNGLPLKTGRATPVALCYYTHPGMCTAVLKEKR